MGIVSWLGFPATLISLEVVPFLTLAIGVDNMFLIAHGMGRQVMDVSHSSWDGASDD
jgi:Niemann-Pick C1 protein